MMSYAKAMRHARNVRKSRKQAKMHFGFDTGSAWPNPRRNPEVAALIQLRDWFTRRHDGDKKHHRECIRETIAEIRQIRKGTTNE